MVDTDLLLRRLDAIGAALAERETALALIGLGSVGQERSRLDRYSDLDFFAIVKSGAKAAYLHDLTWLTALAPVAYFFQNTPDGYKLLYADGVFCEFAVFEEAELAQAAFAPGRVIWKAAGVSDAIALPRRQPAPAQSATQEWLLGEALTNLWVGMARDRRGEKLSAMRFIQGYAIDRILELSQQVIPATAADADPFNFERRYEQRFPEMRAFLPGMLQGYERNRQSALAALAFLDAYFAIPSAIKQAVQSLCEGDDPIRTFLKSR